MIVLKTARELELMREAGRISAMALQVAGEHIKPGVTTKEIDTIVHDYIVGEGAIPSFLGYGGFPGSACISINNEVIHGIPKKTKVIQPGDIVSVDVGACIHGFHGDNAFTFPVGEISEEAQRLLDVTRQSLELGVKAAVAGNRIGDIGHAVQTYVEANGMAVVKKYVGHGVGEHLHESPDVPNFGRPGRGARLVPGMTIAIEPMVNAVGENVRVLADDWTTVTVSGSLSAHFEYTIAITENGPVVLTRP
ncbi:type I methionyl aminopeptidase [Zongyangia hominis]|uniref:Methionine aminopeptidase n=1 Tax=Zongyangia hominis TaxID=2763677 RepID=A0A926IBG9_9FIRM|nr:type I methionyl aminopeptidase [Zongyangia hominis]MBC8570273.1 type I methionyl aminopeptidase [Zongyangia hominis]